MSLASGGTKRFLVLGDYFRRSKSNQRLYIGPTSETTKDDHLYLNVIIMDLYLTKSIEGVR